MTRRKRHAVLTSRWLTLLLAVCALAVVLGLLTGVSALVFLAIIHEYRW